MDLALHGVQIAVLLSQPVFASLQVPKVHHARPWRQPPGPEQLPCRPGDATLRRRGLLQEDPLLGKFPLRMEGLQALHSWTGLPHEPGDT